MAWQRGAMVAARRIIALSVDADQRLALVEISRSRTEPANRVERARIILAYLEEPSAYAVARTMGVSQQTVTRCLERTVELGVLAALDEPRAHGTGCDDYGGGQNLACRAGLRKADAIRLPARAVDDPSAGSACARSRTARRPSEPGQPGPRNGVQDPGSACDQAAPGAVLPGAARSRVRTEDGRGAVRLS